MRLNIIQLSDLELIKKCENQASQKVVYYIFAYVEEWALKLQCYLTSLDLVN